MFSNSCQVPTGEIKLLHLKQTVTESLGKSALEKATGTQVMKKVTWIGEEIYGIGTSAFLQPLNTNLLCMCNVHICDCVQECVDSHR